MSGPGVNWALTLRPYFLFMAATISWKPWLPPKLDSDHTPLRTDSFLAPSMSCCRLAPAAELPAGFAAALVPAAEAAMAAGALEVGAAEPSAKAIRPAPNFRSRIRILLRPNLAPSYTAPVAAKFL